MRDLADRALDLAQVRGAVYSDVRIVQRRTQTINVKNGRIEGVSDDESQGFGVRLVLGGAWGFASSHRLDFGEVDRVTALAAEIARASSLVGSGNVDLGPALSLVATYRTPIALDPFDVSLNDKVSLLMAADTAMQRSGTITVAESSLECRRETTYFASSEGSRIEQELIETGGGIEATASNDEDVQKRSYPNSFGRQQGKAGYEFVQAMGLAENAERIAEEATQLLTAKPCPRGIVTTIILDPTQVALQLHESCGHPTELDRVYGTEIALAGTSFIAPHHIGSFRYGADIVNVTCDATLPGGLGTFGYDDEGIPAQRTSLVRDGVFVGFQTDRETAARLGTTSNGCARADGWNRIPLVRMTNVNLEPGDWMLEGMIADTDDGIFMHTNKSWSIDDRRLNFQFGTEIAWRIKNGKLGAMLKNATYSGLTPAFWQSCDAIGNSSEWTIWGVTNCGKGQPEQVAHVGHGTAAARFRGVNVGVMPQ